MVTTESGFESGSCSSTKVSATSGGRIHHEDMKKGNPGLFFVDFVHFVVKKTVHVRWAVLQGTEPGKSDGLMDDR